MIQTGRNSIAYKMIYPFKVIICKIGVDILKLYAKIKSNFWDGDNVHISTVQRAGAAENLWRRWWANGPLRARGKALNLMRSIWGRRPALTVENVLAFSWWVDFIINKGGTADISVLCIGRIFLFYRNIFRILGMIFRGANCKWFADKTICVFWLWSKLLIEKPVF